MRPLQKFIVASLLLATGAAVALQQWNGRSVAPPVHPAAAAQTPAPAVNATPEPLVQETTPARVLVEQLVGQIAVAASRQLHPEQMRDLPDDLKPHGTPERMSEEQIARIEAQLQGEEVPATAESLPCPDPADLPENLRNELNRQALRERGCKL